MTASLTETVRQLLRASPSLVAATERSGAPDDVHAAAEIARLRDEVRRLQAVVEAVIVTFAQEHAASDASIERRLVKAMRAARDRTEREASAEPPVLVQGSPFRGIVPVDPNACARCGAPLGDDSSAFVANVGSVCTACYRASDAR